MSYRISHDPEHILKKYIPLNLNMKSWKSCQINLLNLVKRANKKWIMHNQKFSY